jgi:hypothetical protein
MHAQLSGQHAIFFDSNDPTSAASEKIGQGAATWTDLEHGVVQEIAERLDDSHSGGGVGEKVLAQLGFSSGRRHA